MLVWAELAHLRRGKGLGTARLLHLPGNEEDARDGGLVPLEGLGDLGGLLLQVMVHVAHHVLLRGRHTRAAHLRQGRHLGRAEPAQYGGHWGVVVRGRHRGKWKKSLVKKESTGQNGNGRALVVGDEKPRGALPPLPNKASVSAPTTTLVPDEPEKIVRESTSVGRWTKPCTTRRNSLGEVKEGVLLLCSEKPPPAPPGPGPGSR